MKYLFIILFALSTTIGSAQSNLIYNGDFELLYDTSCIGSFSHFIENSINWWNPINTSPDLFIRCGLIPLSIPNNNAGYQNDSRNKNVYTGIATYYTFTPNYREYIMCKIKKKLEVNKKYKIIFQVSNSDFYFYASNIGCCFEKDSFFQLPQLNFAPTYPDYTFMTDSIIRDCNNWTEVSFEFIPIIADLQYLVIGSFPETKPLMYEVHNPIDFCSPPLVDDTSVAYYLIDDVRLYCLDCDTSSYCALALPDAFTPNTDGLNDEWKPLINADCIANIDNYLLRIFNRWGEVVYTTHDKNETWKGVNNEIGTYIYYLQYDDKDKTQIKQGNIELIR
jgi:gliding motility-associated-like protein